MLPRRCRETSDEQTSMKRSYNLSSEQDTLDENLPVWHFRRNDAVASSAQSRRELDFERFNGLIETVAFNLATVQFRNGWEID
jgi:hypothetical protein